jgi:hypothetical protein
VVKLAWIASLEWELLFVSPCPCSILFKLSAIAVSDSYILLRNLGLTLSNLSGFGIWEFEGFALKWGSSPHPAKEQGLGLYLRKSLN